MLKKIMLIVVLSVFGVKITNAQIIKLHSQWAFSTKKINDCEYDLIFTVTLDKGWHTFSIVPLKGFEKEVATTEILFTPGKEYTLVGSIKESKPTPEYDPTIEQTVQVHYNKVTFTQRVKLKSAGDLKISGTYQNQSCKEMCETAPKRKFNFDLSGVSCN